MKTTDLIPLILHQLVDEDKYGYDIVKKIEDDSNGVINIKQPTLYSLLKKLEQSRFITSYWKDSEIGGKRHYYRITDNGKAQIDTYPSYEQLIAECCEETVPTALPHSETHTPAEPSVDFSSAAEVEPIPSPSASEPVDLTTSLINEQPELNISQIYNTEPRNSQSTHEESASQTAYDEPHDSQPIDIEISASQQPYGTMPSANQVDYATEPTETQPAYDAEPKITPIDLLKNVEQPREEAAFTPIKIDISSPTVQPQVEEEKSIEVAADDTTLSNVFEQTSQPINIFDGLTAQGDDEQDIKPASSISIFDAIAPDEEHKDALNADTNSSIASVTPSTSTAARENFEEQSCTISSVDINPHTPQVETNINPKLAEQVTELNVDLREDTEKQDLQIINHDAVAYVNYVNFKTDTTAVERRKMLKASTQKMVFTTLTLLVLIGITIALAIKTSFTSMYCVALIISGLFTVFYPLLFARNRTKLRLKYCTKPLAYNALMDFFIKLSIFLILSILVFAYNIKICHQFADIFTLDNISNILSPILLSLILLIDFGYSYLCYKKFKVKK